MKTSHRQIHLELAALRRDEKATARAYRVTLDAHGQSVRRKQATAEASMRA